MRLISAASGTVAAGVAINQILNGGVWNLSWLIVSLVVAVAAEGLNLWLNHWEPAAGKGHEGTPSRTIKESFPAATVEGTQSLSPPRQLPRTIQHFTDRTAEISAVEVFRKNASDLVLISGLPGVGKTAFAVQWAHSAKDQFPDGQLYANLHGYGPHPSISPVEILNGFLRMLGVAADRIPADLDGMAAIYRSFVHDRRLLIVLDNASSADQVRPLLPSSPTCLTLVTSRSRLRSLVSQDGAGLVVLPPLPEPEALTLFRSVAGAELSADDASLAPLVRQCGLLPLTIRIAAEHVNEQGSSMIGSLVSELNEEGRRLDVFASADEDGSVARNIFSWSYQSLRPDAARMFRLMGLNPGTDLWLPAAAALADISVPKTRRLLSSLTSINLVEQVGSERYQFHDLIRDYAIERVNIEATNDERRAASRRLLEFYLNTTDSADRVIAPQRRHVLSERATSVHVFADPQEALAWCEAERLNLLRAIDYSVTLGFDDLAWRLPVALTYFFVLHNYQVSRLDTSRIAVEAARRSGDRYGEAWSQRCIGGAEIALGRQEEALDSFGAALEICREIGDRSWEGYDLGNIAHALFRLGRFDEARDHSVQSLEIQRELGNVRGESIQLALLGRISFRLGRLDEAYDHYEKAAERAKGVDLQAEGDALQGLGETCTGRAENASAIAWYRRAADVRRRVDDHLGLATTLASLGSALIAIGETESAREALTESLSLYEALEHPSSDTVRQSLDQLTQR